MSWKCCALLVFINFVNLGCSSPNDIASKSQNGFGIGKQQWGFVDVREGAHMFWWLHYTTASNIKKPNDRPLAIWLQGGPGASSTGYGNFEEIGPFDLELNERNFTWVKDMNVLFIDSPVGSGFSHVDKLQYLTTNNTQVAKDLIETLRGFFKLVPEFKTAPLHIFGESYGGKVAVEFAYLLDQEIKLKSIECNLKSVNSIDGWISPIDSMTSWAPFLYNMGFVDRTGFDAIKNMTEKTKKAIEKEQFLVATLLWGATEGVIYEKTQGIDFYNVLRPVKSRANDLRYRLRKSNINDAMIRTLIKFDEDDRDAILANLLTNSVTQALNITSDIPFGSQSSDTFSSLSYEFMKPAISYVEKLLNETSIEVNIITGQLDLIVATPGTVKWVKKLKWPGAIDYKTADRKIILVDNVLEGYYKKQGNFGFYWINRSGHMVPLDNPNAMDYLLRKVTKYNE